MISEQEFSFEKNKNDILQKLSETGVYEENQKIIKYFGNKNQIPLEEEEKIKHLLFKNIDNKNLKYIRIKIQVLLVMEDV